MKAHLFYQHVVGGFQNVYVQLYDRTLFLCGPFYMCVCVCTAINTSSVHVLCGGTEHQNANKTDYNIHVEMIPKVFCLLCALSQMPIHMHFCDKRLRLTLRMMPRQS